MRTLRAPSKPAATRVVSNATHERRRSSPSPPLDDERLPANAAHVRAAIGNTLGRLLHQCFVPPGQTAASLPFVTWYTGVLHCSS